MQVHVAYIVHTLCNAQHSQSSSLRIKDSSHPLRDLPLSLSTFTKVLYLERCHVPGLHSIGDSLNEYGAMMEEYWSGKPEVLDKQNLSLWYFEHHKIPHAWPGLNLGVWGKKLTTHRKIHGTALRRIGVLFAHTVLFVVEFVFIYHSQNYLFLLRVHSFDVQVNAHRDKFL